MSGPLRGGTGADGGPLSIPRRRGWPPLDPAKKLVRPFRRAKPCAASLSNAAGDPPRGSRSLFFPLRSVKSLPARPATGH